MALAACARCGEETPEENLLYHAAGRICAGCELDIDEADQTHRGVVANVLVGPMVAFTGSVAFCFGSFGGIPMMAAGAYGAWTGLTSLLEARRVFKTDDAAVGGLGRGMLVVSGLGTLGWSLLLLLVGAFETLRLTGLVLEPRGMMQLALPV
jgi:hypothetical protein